MQGFAGLRAPLCARRSRKRQPPAIRSDTYTVAAIAMTMPRRQMRVQVGHAVQSVQNQDAAASTAHIARQAKPRRIKCAGQPGRRE